ncbi:hypothetical protein [Solemya velum gill symbiont]|nr:hypothetical protein [Solemya velum gill symbiont]OOZ57814.1 hypothetical protein BOW43_12285 [Solemya velum gill symbiont]
MKILKRGLKFTPKPGKNVLELQTDIQEFCRKLRLKEYFADKEEQQDGSLVRNKSDFNPPRGRDQHLDGYIETLSKFPIESNGERKRNNISREERAAIHHLGSDTSIVIKEADKGGTIVIMDSGYYMEKVEEQLKDTKYYKELQEPIDENTMRKIQRLVSKHPNCTTEKEADFLTKFECKTSHFYGLPKVHKSSEIQKAVRQQNSEHVEVYRPNDLKLRPIVAGPSCATHRLSEFLDIILKPLCQKIPSFLKDDIDFIRSLPAEIDENSIFASFDVTSLYTNIPHDLGLQAINYWVNRYRDTVESRFSTEFIAEAMEIILKNNSFIFNSQHYLQLVGTAMGTKVAPTYANLVMGFLEQKLYQRIEEQYQTETSKHIKKAWKRFLDDCFLYWNLPAEQLKDFHDQLNSLHPAIQFTMEIGEEQIPFLDVLVKKRGSKITTDIYYKDTDNHQYLDFHSSHPSHTKRNIPYCLARRICTIVDDRETLERRLEELVFYLTKQHYPLQLIEAGIQRAKAIPIEELRAEKNKETDNNIIPFVTTYIPEQPNVISVARTNIPILHRSDKMKQIIQAKHILPSKRQPKNLKKLITKANFSTGQAPKNRIEKCGDSRCGTCKHLTVGEQIILKNGMNIKPNANMNCKTKNLVYCITCPGCSEWYIGQTGNSLCERMRIHRQQIRSVETRQIPLSAHLETCGSGHFLVFPFHKMTDLNTQKRILKENTFIKLFKPKLNS